ncbi:hypothetical protein DICVIV_13767 [Dictyocaulus viviparus]|uniref:Uncharacterized protein n=1 Tax=Dictyocaulus viviparus TaxID=29172 RepID=A0A0D8X9J0_DICVI|nr:hypothetical protein DICVIV_13767 [Dictyocaulus viviparus]
MYQALNAGTVPASVDDRILLEKRKQIIFISTELSSVFPSASSFQLQLSRDYLVDTLQRMITKN